MILSEAASDITQRAGLAKIVTAAYQGEPKRSQVDSESNASVAAAEIALSRLAADGDSEATTRLLKLVAPTILRSVRLVLGARHPDVDDIFQQSLISLVQSLPAFRGDCHPAGFASRIAIHTAISSRRRAQSARVHLNSLVAISQVQEQEGPSPRADSMAAQRRQLVRQLLEQLPSEQAETLALHVMMGYSLTEVALAMSAPLNTVKSRLRLAKGALKRTLDQNPSLVEQLEVES